ncbi:trimeric intracellular cation channel family protein [Flavihumibacter rivuli]|uniref:trimeric intracellular cation channel family protein n=1 Tax=Flavihumibacter rivuli TaxID=2838156 RepID=UPI001BDED1AA|nr:trimeric intracellular cation channel family protein [Flavihumibacter rivuli]ULQ56827.1 trimeric intracellular cation channel family protein [Flavihumibacter rivuli]
MNYFPLIELAGTFAFAVSGAFAAMKHEMDPFGVLILSFVPAIGGGTLRDILIDDLPVAWLRDNVVLWVIVLAGIASMIFGSYLKKMNRLMFLFDALGLGLFTIAGIEKGIAHHYTGGVAIALGIMTGCFGGVIRDVLVNEVPMLFRKEIYALASMSGGIVYLLLGKLDLFSGANEVISILVIVLVRYLSVQRGWSLPLIYKSRSSTD